MFWKVKWNVKKAIALLMAVSCMIGMLVGCGGQKTDAGGESGSSDWFEVDQEAGILTIRIPDEKPGYAWDFTINDDSLLELVTEENNDNTFVASFRALEDGETVVSFTYAQNAALEEIRALNVVCKDGKVTDVSTFTVKPTEIQPGDDQEIADLRNSNSIPAIMQNHKAVTCVSETWDGENNWQNKAVRQFVSSEGRLWYDYEQYDDADGVVYCEAGYVNDDVPGALYYWEKDGAKSMQLCPASEYETFAAERWLPRIDGDYETVESSETNEEYQTIILTAHRQNTNTGISADVIYFISAETGMITGTEVTEYSSEDDSVASVTRSNILYDEPRLMEEQAAMRILFPEDACYLTVVVNPGKEDSEEQSFQVDKSTEVEFDALEDYEMYYDYDCTQPMDWIDVGQNKLTVYITTDTAK